MTRRQVVVVVVAAAAKTNTNTAAVHAVVVVVVLENKFVVYTSYIYISRIMSWIPFCFAIFVWLVLYFSIIWMVYIKEIKDNWPIYRCNPMYMPLSSDMAADFTYCVQNMQADMMGTLLMPLQYTLSNVTNLGGELGDSLNFVRASMDSIRTFTGTIVEMIFGVFVNIIIEFQRIGISLKDTFGKTIAIIAVLLYELEGVNMTLNSAWNGVPGETMRAVQKVGNCFAPDTVVLLSNGQKVTMENVCIGDVLSSGAVVHAVMRISARPGEEVIHCIPGRGVDQTDLYVTGSHFVWSQQKNKFEPVKDYHRAYPTQRKVDFYSCLITDTHQINLGNETFWDWDDYLLRG
jgi:hypothetical protein